MRLYARSPPARAESEWGNLQNWGTGLVDGSRERMQAIANSRSASLPSIFVGKFEQFESVVLNFLINGGWD